MRTAHVHAARRRIVPMPAHVVCMAVLAATFTAHGHAEDFERDQPTARWTGTSGTGDSAFLEYTPSVNLGIYGVGVAETGDKPQEINFLNNILSSGAGRTLGGEFLQLFNGSTGFKYAKLPADHFVTAVQTCVNNNRIKGVRLWGQRLGTSGLPTGNSRQVDFTRTNCGSKDWAEKVACGEEKVAVGARANYYGNYTGSKTSFSGITLLCAKLKPR
jgi:hypothetical protein